jgi:tripartite-type tricarboxylate transporter receptor subunit TctC
MRLIDRALLQVAVAIAAIFGMSGSAASQAYPVRPITIIVPFAPGGATDVIARALGEHMRKSLGQTVIIETVSGANGSIGVGRVARAPADGYTIGIGQLGTHVINGAIYALPYDLLKDLDPIALVADSPQMIISKNAVPAQNLRELIAWLRTNPGKSTLGYPGPGSAPHIVGTLFQKLTETRLQFVPYRGGGPAMQDLIAGQVDLNIPLAAVALPHVRAGKIKAYAVTAKTRLESAPEIPTVDEAGTPGLHISNWHGLWAPKGTPKMAIAKLNAAVVEALTDPTVRTTLADLGQTIYPREQQTPDALGAFQRAEIEKWWPIIKAMNIRVE